MKSCWLIPKSELKIGALAYNLDELVVVVQLPKQKGGCYLVKSVRDGYISAAFPQHLYRIRE